MHTTLHIKTPENRFFVSYSMDLICPLPFSVLLFLEHEHSFSCLVPFIFAMISFFYYYFLRHSSRFRKSILLLITDVVPIWLTSIEYEQIFDDLFSFSFFFLLRFSIVFKLMMIVIVAMTNENVDIDFIQWQSFQCSQSWNRRRVREWLCGCVKMSFVRYIQINCLINSTIILVK